MLRSTVTLLLCFLLGCHSHALRPSHSSKATPAEHRSTSTTPKKFSELVAGAHHQRGLFDLYQKEGQVYLAVKKEQLDESFLLVSHIERGNGSRELFAGKQQALRICQLHRRGDTVYLLQRSSYFATPAGSDWEQSVEQSYAPTVLDSAKVEATRPDGAVLVAVQGWLTSDLTYVAALVQREQKSAKSARPPDSRRSFLESAQAFPDNVTFSALLTFAAGEDSHSASLPDERFVPVGVSYTLMRLPQTPMLPRAADDRIGVNAVIRHAPGQVIEPTVRYAARWRLRPGQPLVFYLDPALPAEYRPFVTAGIKAWERALTAAGWAQMIVVKPLEKGAALGDLRFLTLRWETLVSARINGVTSSVVDPRTGELLSTTVVLDGDSLLDHRLLRLMLMLQGKLRPGEPLPLEFVGQMIKKTTMHEVGHALGLPHNFAASLATPVDKLSDAEWVKTHGVASSVMDYPAVNLPMSLATAIDPGFPIFNQDIGPSDIWAIRYLYERDDKQAKELARTAAQSGHRYARHDQHGDDEDPDPTVATHDLGSDPLQWTQRRLQLLREILAALPGPLPGVDGRAAELTEQVGYVLTQYSTAAQLAVRYLGGYQSFFDHTGDPVVRPTAVAIPKRQQQEALALLTQAVFQEDAVMIPAQVRGQMGVDAFHPFVTDPVLRAQTQVQLSTLRALLAANVMTRLKVSEVRFGAANTLTLAELFEAVDSMVFGAPGSVVSAIKRELQREYVERLAGMVLSPWRDVPKDARALAREHLSLQRQRLEATRGGDAISTAHRRDLAARMGQVLDAQLLERSL
jgi:hypothetical protein